MKAIFYNSLIVLALTFFAQSLFAGGLPQKLPVKRGPAAFTQGFKVLKKNCPIYKVPSRASKSLFRAQQGSRIYMTAMDSQWLIAHTKKKISVYVHRNCIN